jgi:hypothetical protein
MLEYFIKINQKYSGIGAKFKEFDGVFHVEILLADK